MPAEPIVLRNRYLAAAFCPSTGRLLELGEPGGPPVVVGSGCRWLQDDELWTEAGQLVVGTVKTAPGSVRSVIEEEGLTVERRYELTEGAPLLAVTVTISGAETKVISHVGLPRVELAADVADVFEDDEDLYFDGEELGGGLELPCWRVFFRNDRRAGLLLATRSKLDMSHVQILGRAFEIKPHVMTNYDTDYHLPVAPMSFEDGTRWVSRFELGPWRRDAHAHLLDAAALRRPVSVAGPSLRGELPASVSGLVIDAVELASADVCSEAFAPDRWLRVLMPGCRSGIALMCGPSVQPPPITVNPGVTGVHRVSVGIGSGHGIVARFSGDPHPTIRMAARGGEGRTPFHLHLSGCQEVREVWLRTLDMTGISVTLSRFPNSYATTMIDYVRFEPLTEEETEAWQARQHRAPAIQLSGFNDIPDIARLTDARDPDPQIYAANLWEHANAKVRKVFWRIDGQCSDYPSRLNTMRYVSARVHGVFHPQGKAYGRALRKTDMLRLAVDTANRFDLDLYGWMRFNNYGGNVQSDFFRKHPEFHEEWDSGCRACKLCLAFPEVRAHKIGILVEAAKYGLHGLCLGFLRHPPILVYAPLLVQGYREMYGQDPPRDRDDSDPICRHRFPPDTPEHLRWYAYRASFMTTFMRDLKAALAAEGLGKLPVAIWVRANHCLFDGIDLPTWLDEGLVDEVVADDYNDPAVCQPTPEWRAMVQEKADLMRGINGLEPEGAWGKAKRIVAAGYDGLCTYESDYTVLQDAFIELYEALRG